MSLDDPLLFTKTNRQTGTKKTASDRLIDFQEIYHRQSEEVLQQQAGRCLDCGNPYCEWKCPLHNYIPNWLDLVNKNQILQAASLMHETNPLPEICGRVCPQDRLCEQACTLNTGFGAVTIGAIEKNVADMALENNWRPDLSKVAKIDKKVAIIGAGPAGLGCAEFLVRNGLSVVVYDKNPEIGGLLTFGIPNFKLDKAIIRKRRHYFQDIGIEFQLNVEIGKQMTIEQLQNDFDAVFLGMGCYQSVDGQLPGRESRGVLHAIDYLIGNINQQQDYQMTDYPFYDLKDKNVVVLGGGDTAMDCVRSAVRQKANSVSCVYRRDEQSMPGSKQEYLNAKEEGVNFLFNLQPISIESKSNRVTGVRFLQTSTLSEQQLKPAAEDTQKTDIENFSLQKYLTIIDEKNCLLNADFVIIAFGFSASPARWFKKMDIQTQASGLVKTGVHRPSAACSNHPDFSYQTNNQNIFAGGDMVRGADLVVTAIADGRRAGKEIMQFLQKD